MFKTVNDGIKIVWEGLKLILLRCVCVCVCGGGGGGGGGEMDKICLSY